MTPQARSKIQPDDIVDDLIDGDDTGDDDSGDDQAIFSLDTPEPARALQASRPPRKGPAKPKGLKKKLSGKDHKGVDIDITDAAADLAADSEREPPVLSAFDRDEITDPESDPYHVEPLSILAGLYGQLWEDEGQAPAEDRLSRAGYHRNLEHIGGRTTRQAVVSARHGAALSIAVAAPIAIAAAVNDMSVKGPSIAGVSKGPQRAPDQDTPEQTPSLRRKTEEPRPSIHRDIGVSSGPLLRRRDGVAPAAPVYSRQEKPVRIREDDTLLFAEDPFFEILADAVAQPAPLPQDSVQSDVDAGFRRTMEMIYTLLGPETFAVVSPARRAGWDEKRLEQKENAADLTRPQPQPEPPERDYRYNMQINFGPGGPG